MVQLAPMSSTCTRLQGQVNPKPKRAALPKFSKAARLGGSFSSKAKVDYPPIGDWSVVTMMPPDRQSTAAETISSRGVGSEYFNTAGTTRP